MRGHVFSRLRARASFANLTALLAMFIALGGSSYAAVKITGNDVRNGSLSGRDVRNGSLTGRDISISGRNIRGLTAADFGAGQLPTGPRWLLINESGDIEEQSGGFTVVSKPGINGQPATNPNIYVNAGSSLIAKGLTASIAIQNKLDRTGDMVRGSRIQRHRSRRTLQLGGDQLRAHRHQHRQHACRAGARRQHRRDVTDPPRVGPGHLLGLV